jgi:hypothetical protein
MRRVLATAMCLLPLVSGCTSLDGPLTRYRLEQALWHAQFYERRINITFMRASRRDTQLAISAFRRVLEADPLADPRAADWDPDVVEDMLTHIRALRAVAGRDEVRGLSAENLDKLDDAICQIIHGVADKMLPTSETPYHHTASWVDAVRREAPIEIFTTNYDLLMEQAFEDARVPYFDGFAGVRKPSRLKLHLVF